MATDSKHDVIARLSASRESLERALVGVSPDELGARPLAGGWSLRDMLAHVAGLDEVAAADAARVRGGASPLLSTWKAEEADTWNAFFVNTRANFSPEQVLDELHGQRFRLLAELATLPPREFEEGTFLRYALDAISHHEQHHAGELAAVPV
jgi:hypothetical protein